MSSIENHEQTLSPEKFGKNVSIDLRIIRHGDRDPKTNMLTDYGRQETAKRAEESGWEATDFDIIHAVGSTVGPYDQEGRGRAEATAHIYAGQIAKTANTPEGIKNWNTRKTEVVAFDKYKNPPPYDHHKVYNSFLPENFDELGDSEKAAAGVIAQGKTVEHVLALDTPEAERFKEEAAGSLAYLITHYQELSHRLPSGRVALLPAGVHGPTMEFLLQKTLITEYDTWPKRTYKGFKKLSEIGGQHNVSEAFTVHIDTDENGNDKELRIDFDNPARPVADKMTLNPKIVKDLAQKFEVLHSELRGLREKKEE